MAMTSKAKVPEVVMNPASAVHYRNHGDRFVGEGLSKIGYRYDQVEGRKFVQCRDGKEHANNVTLSQPSSEVLTLLKKNEEFFLVMGKQSRSPYLVEVDGTVYLKTFLEQAAGLVEDGQDFLSAAISEGKQELGSKVTFISELIVPKLYRHVSYTDEVSRLYWAITENLGEQELDEKETIYVEIIPLENAKREFKDYLDGKKSDFFGFDIPDITMLSMTLFFWKLNSGEIDLENPTGNLL